MRRPHLAVGLIFFIAIISLGHLKAGSRDAMQRLAMTQSILFDHSFITSQYGAVKYGPLQSILMIPPYLLGYAAGALIGQSDERRHHTAYRFCAFLFTPGIVAILCAWYAHLLSLLKFRYTIAMLSTFSLLFCTLLLPYSRIMLSEPLNALLLFLSMYYLFLYRSRKAVRYVRISFLAMGLLYLNNFVFVLHYLLFSIYICLYDFIFEKRENLGRLLIHSSLTLLCATIIWVIYNASRYGQYFLLGYGNEGFTTPFFIGAYGLLFSIGRGMLIYTPITVICLLYFVTKYQNMDVEFREVSLFFVCLFVVHFAIYSKWHSFEGGWCWGPRFLLPFIPLLHLSAPFLLRSFCTFNLISKLLLILACFYTFSVNGINYIGHWEDYERSMFLHTDLPYLASVFDPQYAALLNGWDVHLGLQQLPQFIIVSALTLALLVYWRRRIKAQA